ncbi:MAG: TetR/AcrR family transcriptional regulator [Pyruvatibacter sp.]
MSGRAHFAAFADTPWKAAKFVSTTIKTAEKPLGTQTSSTSSSSAMGKRERTKVENRQAILDAARLVFAELGYGETTVRDIIRRTGLASGTFYNYFKSKDEVFQAMMDASALRMRPRIRAERIRAASFEEFISASFRAYFDYLEQDEQMHRIIRRKSGSMRVRMDTPEVVAVFDELRLDIDRAISQDVLPKVDPEYLTAAFVGIAFEVGDRMQAREPFDSAAAAEFATKLFLGGVNALPRLEDSD